MVDDFVGCGVEGMTADALAAVFELEEIDALDCVMDAVI